MYPPLKEPTLEELSHANLLVQCTVGHSREGGDDDEGITSHGWKRLSRN